MTAAPGSGRLLCANLDAEIEMARAATAGPHRGVKPAVARRIAAAGSWMAVLARPGDRLWLPASVPAAELAGPARRAGLAVESGPLEQVAPAAEVLGWGETDRVARLRLGPPAESGTPDAAPAGWIESLWDLVPDPAVVRQVNHRGFALTLSFERGTALPGARTVGDVAELERHLAGGGARASRTGTWVVKAPYSAAGRERLRLSRQSGCEATGGVPVGGTGAELDPDARTRVERLLSRFGSLVFEPWVERVRDLACAGVVHRDRVQVFPPHQLETDRAGVFRAATIDDGATGYPGPDADAVTGAARAAGAALAAAGYLGPFSVDAFAWRDPAGAVRLQPMSEINARLTFGLLARAAAALAAAPAGPYALRLDPA